jgi:hypothetical protein
MLATSTPVMTGVIVRNAEHPRNGQAGAYLGANKDAPETRGNVRFDVDGQTEAIPFADLERL